MISKTKNTYGREALPMLIDEFREDDNFSPTRMSERLFMSRAEFARMVGLPRQPRSRPTSVEAQPRLAPIAHILDQAEKVTGDADRAILWFKYQPIPGHNGLTARDLVEADNAHAVITYLEELLDGAYA